MDKIYVFGHRKPDTDSCAAAISYSYLKQTLGYNTVPVIISSINPETKFALDYFDVATPMFLNDVRLKISDVKYKKNCVININDSLFNAYQLMLQSNFNRLAVTDNDGKLIDTIGMKDLAKYLIDKKSEKLLSTYDYITQAIGGKEVLRFDDEIVGNLLVASFKSTTFMKDVKLDKNSILIVGDRHSIIEYAVNSKIKLLILSGNSKIKSEHLKIAKKNKVNIIKVDNDTLTIVKNIILADLISLVVEKEKTISCLDSEALSEFVKLINNEKYSYYPVVNKSGKCLGMITPADINNVKKKKVILVDHNSFEQSIEGLLDAEILEVIDHHNIGSVGTSKPINFRNMPVGSTNTIIYQLYKENNVKIPKQIAGVMLSGILSDTLILNSPTTTEYDKVAVKNLSKMAKVNYKEYGISMLKAGASLKDKTKEEIIYQDFKSYPYRDGMLGAGQISTTNPEIILKDKKEYVDLLNKLSVENNFEIMAFFITDILNNGSYILFNDSALLKLEKAFNVKSLKQGQFLKKIVSRKLQVIPLIIDNL